MSSMALARPMLRQSGLISRMAARRFESTATAKATGAAKETASKATGAAKDTASKATDAAKDTASKVSATASEYSAKAGQGLSRVTSAAGPAITGAAKGVASSLGKIGGRTGKLIGFVERQVPQVIYYSRVGLEVGRLVFRGQKMTPPSVSTFQSYFQQAWKTVQNPGSLLQSASQTASKATQQPASILQQAQNISRAQVVAGGVLVAELLGFFTVGEIIGRFKVIGYHGDGGAAHH